MNDGSLLEQADWQGYVNGSEFVRRQRKLDNVVLRTLSRPPVSRVGSPFLEAAHNVLRRGARYLPTLPLGFPPPLGLHVSTCLSFSSIYSGSILDLLPLIYPSSAIDASSALWLTCLPLTLCAETTADCGQACKCPSKEKHQETYAEAAHHAIKPEDSYNKR